MPFLVFVYYFKVGKKTSSVLVGNLIFCFVLFFQQIQNDFMDAFDTLESVVEDYKLAVR